MERNAAAQEWTDHTVIFLLFALTTYSNNATKTIKALQTHAGNTKGAARPASSLALWFDKHEKSRRFRVVLVFWKSCFEREVGLVFREPLLQCWITQKLNRDREVARYKSTNHLLMLYMENGKVEDMFPRTQAALNVWLRMLAPMTELKMVGTKTLTCWWLVVSIFWKVVNVQTRRAQRLWCLWRSESGVLCAGFWVKTYLLASVLCVTKTIGNIRFLWRKCSPSCCAVKK